MIPVEIRPALAEDLPAILAWRSTTTLAPYRPQCIRCRPARSPSGKRGLMRTHCYPASTVDQCPASNVDHARMKCPRSKRSPPSLLHE